MDIKRGWSKEAIPVFVLFAGTLLFFSDVLFRNEIFIHRDLLRFFYPLREFSRAQFLSGKIPLWDPYIHCGSPHLAELQTCVFYPLSIIYQFFSYPRAFNYFIIIHVFLAGWFTYLLMREWRHSRYASFLSASVFMTSGYIISVINLLASLASVIWLPLVILFYGRALRDKLIRNSIISGIFLTLMFLGGEPAILLATIFILVIFGIADTPKRLKVMFKAISLSLLVIASLSCFQMLPFIEFARHSSRGAMDFGEASMWSLPPYALLDLLVPYLSETDYLYKDYWNRQSWLLVYYMGLFTVMCAFISLKFDITKKRKAFFYILALGLILSFGRYTPVYYLLYRFMPGFRFSRYPIKFFFMVAFSLAILAGMGLDYYVKNARSNMALTRFLRKLLVIAFIGAFFYFLVNLKFFEIFNLLYKKMLPFFLDKKGQLNQFIYVTMFNIKSAISYFMILSVVLFLGINRKIKLNIVMPVLIVISLLDIYTANKKLYLNMSIDKYLEPGRTVEFLKKDKALYRIFNSPATLSQNMFVPERDYFEGIKSLKERMVSNRGVSFGIYDAYGYGSLYDKRHEEIIALITQSRLPDSTNLLSMLNVKYVISPKDFKTDGYTLVKKGEKVNIYENKNALPRAFLVHEAVVIRDAKEILERLKSKEFNPAREVILEEDSLFKVPRDTLRGRINILKYSPSEIIIEADNAAKGFLVLSDSYYPGWKAYVDGRPEKVYRADYVLRAVYLGPGKHIVKFTYDPLSFKIGTIITLLTIVMIFAYFRTRPNLDKRILCYE